MRLLVSSLGVKLLALLGIGFLQGLYALDAADGQTDDPTQVRGFQLNILLTRLIGAVLDIECSHSSVATVRPSVCAITSTLD